MNKNIKINSAFLVGLLIIGGLLQASDGDKKVLSSKPQQMTPEEGARLFRGMERSLPPAMTDLIGGFVGCPRYQLDRTLQHESDVLSVAYSPKGSQLAVGLSNSSIVIWNVATADIARRLDSVVRSIAYSPNGMQLTSGGDDGKVIVWNSKDLVFDRVLYSGMTPVLSISYRPDGQRFAAAAGVVKIWDASGKEIILNHPAASLGASSVAYGPLGGRLAVGLDTGYVYILSNMDGVGLASSVAYFKAYDSGILSVSYSPNGMHIASSSLSDVRIFDAARGASIQRLGLENYQGMSRSLPYSPDGAQLAVASGSTVALFDTPAGSSECYRSIIQTSQELRRDDEQRERARREAAVQEAVDTGEADLLQLLPE